MQSAGLCVTVVRKSVTLHHRTQCEVYSLWASQPQQQRNQGKWDWISTGCRMLHYPAQVLSTPCSSASGANNKQWGKKCHCHSFDIKINAPRTAQLHTYIIPDKCAFRLFLISMGKKKINIFTTYPEGLAKRFSSLPTFLCFSSVSSVKG